MSSVLHSTSPSESNEVHQWQSQTAKTDFQPYKHLSHCELARLCSSSSTHPAWTEFHARFYRLIYSYIYKALNKYNSNGHTQMILLDLIQEVFLTLLLDNLKALKQFRSSRDGAFLAYLKKISENLVKQDLNYHRALKRFNYQISLEWLIDTDEETYGRSISLKFLSSNNSEQIFLQISEQEFMKRLQVFFQYMNTKNALRDKEVFELHVFDGLSYSEIAKIIGFSLKGIESIIRRVFAKLKQYLALENFDILAGLKLQR